MILNKLNIEQLAQYLILSNTPFYLFKKFSDDESIRSIAKKFSSEHLIKILQDYIKKVEKNIEEFVVIYSIIVALTFKPNHEVNDFFEGLDTLQIKWGNYLKEIYFSTSFTETFSPLDVRYKIIQPFQDNNTITSNDLVKGEQKAKIKLTLE